MKQVCAWCGEVMDPGDPADPRVTHGVCERCNQAWRIEARTAAEAHRQKERREWV